MATRGLAQLKQRWHVYRRTFAWTTGIGLAAGASVVLLNRWQLGEQPRTPATPPSGLLHQQLTRAVGSLLSASDAAVNAAKAVATRWLADRSDDLETREALVAFGSTRLLDFLLATATEEDPNQQQVEAEHVLCNLLTGHHTATAVLQRPMAIPLLLQHAATGKASPVLLARLSAAAGDGANFSRPLSSEEAAATVAVLQDYPESEVEPLALALLTALASSSHQQRQVLISAGGLPRALASAAMSAVNRSAGAREVQQGLCQLMLVLAGDSSAAADADLALWVRPLLFLAADAAAAGDLGLADVAMQSFVRCAGYGGIAVQGALRDLHVLPTLECLARSSDLSLRARAMAAVGPLVKVGLLESERDKATWRDRALGWLVATGGIEQEMSERARRASEQQQGGLAKTLLSFLGLRSAAEALQRPRSSQEASAVAVAAAAAATAVAPEHRVELPLEALQPGSGLWGELQALRRACVSALKALSREEGVAGLQVGHLWLAALLALLAPRVSGASSVTQIVPPEVYAAQLLRQQQEQQQQQQQQQQGGGQGASSAATSTTTVSSSDGRGALSQAAPVTAAYVVSVAEELRAASAAVANSWRAAALELPPELEPGMLAPAVLEAYPAAARVVDLAVAQQRLCRALEVLSAIIADDETKQRWVVSMGVLPLMERFTMYPDATATPAAWLELYSPGDHGQPQVKHAAGTTASKRSGGGSTSSSGWLSGWWGSSKGGAARQQQQLLTAAEEQRALQEQQQAQFEGDLESTLMAQQVQPGTLGDASGLPSSSSSGGGSATTVPVGPSSSSGSADGPGAHSSSSGSPAAAAAAAAGGAKAAATTTSSANSSSTGSGRSPPPPPPAPAASAASGHPDSSPTGRSAAPPGAHTAMDSSSSGPLSQTGSTRVSPAGQQRRFLSNSFAIAQGASDYAAQDLPPPPPASSQQQQPLQGPDQRESGARRAAEADGPALCVSRQAARALSVLCMLPDVAEKVAHGRWLGWLQQAAVNDDCRLSSSATRALLHVEACLAHEGAAHRGNPLSAAAEEVSAFLEELWPFSHPLGPGGSSSSSSEWRPPVRYPDGIHLLQPGDLRHWALARPVTPTLLETLTAAATAAAVNAASDLSDSDFSDMPRAWPLVSAAAPPPPERPPQEHAGTAAGPVQRMVNGMFDRLDQHLTALSERWQLEELETAAVAAAAGPLGAAAAAAAPSRSSHASPISSSCTASCGAAGQQDALTAILVPPPELAAQLAAAEAPVPAPDVDIVFIHGIRGGPFVTWRKGGGPRGRVGSSRHQAVQDCWPTAWLAEDVPGARLLTVEYNAPATGWEGESLSLPDMTPLVLDKLLAAGVGSRPVVFVTHSMGGLLVKEMLHLSAEAPRSSPRAALASAARGVVFFSTPHFGSGLAALGWKLRHVPGAAPAPTVHHLSPGPHLVAINQRLKALSEQRGLRVLSFVEGQGTELAGYIPKVHIVPLESADPGFGRVVVLPEEDHITVCKPKGKDDVSYVEVLAFVRACFGAGAGAVVCEEEQGEGHTSTAEAAAAATA